jgi:hypothetical protein
MNVASPTAINISDPTTNATTQIPPNNVQANTETLVRIPARMGI